LEIILKEFKHLNIFVLDKIKIVFLIYFPENLFLIKKFGNRFIKKQITKISSNNRST